MGFRSRFRIVAVAFLICWAPLQAQEQNDIYDAATVVLSSVDPQFNRILDLDGDGRMDALGLRAGGILAQLRLYRNMGDGSFTGIWNHSISGGVVNGSSPLRIADFNQDGHPDFALGAGNNVHAFITNGFSAPTALPVLPFTSTDRIWDMRIADLDGNGTNDLVVMSRTRLTLYLMDASFNPILTRSASLIILNPESMAIARRTDGSHSLFLASPTSITRFDIPATGDALSPLGTSNPGLAPDHICSGDLDGDGSEEVVIFSDSSNYAIYTQGPGGWSLSAPQPGGPATELADVDGDGDLDGVCCGGGGPSGGPSANNILSYFEVAINHGSGFDLSFKIRGYGADHIAGATDLDGDGDVDLIAGRAIYFSKSPLSKRPFPSLGQSGLSTPGLNFPWLSVDSDGDGDRDMGLTLSAVLVNDGSGNMSDTPLTIANLPNYAFFTNGAPGDWDGDGDIDYIVKAFPAPGQAIFRLVLNQGGGSYEWGPIAIDIPLSQTSWIMANHVRAVDLDNDGDLDAIGGTEFSFGSYSNSDATVICFNDGSGQFTSTLSFPETVKGTADLDGDGLIDLVVSTNGQHPGWRRNLGGGQFAPPSWILSVSGINSWHDRFALADMDVDGDIDILCMNGDYDPVILVNDGFGNFSVLSDRIPDITGNAQTVSILTVSDLNGDGIPDVVVTPAPDSLGCSAIYLATSPMNFGSEVIQCISSDQRFDADGDGDIDFVDVFSRNVHTARLIDPPTGGSRLQYGHGTPGSGGLTPILGASGPFRPGETAVFRLRGGLGNATAFFAFSLAAVEWNDFPFPGTTLYLDPFSPTTAIVPMVLDGSPGVPGAGGFDLPVTVPPQVAGLEAIHQVVILDPGASNGNCFTQALRLSYGN